MSLHQDAPFGPDAVLLARLQDPASLQHFQGERAIWILLQLDLQTEALKLHMDANLTQSDLNVRTPHQVHATAAPPSQSGDDSEMTEGQTGDEVRLHPLSEKTEQRSC